MTPATVKIQVYFYSLRHVENESQSVYDVIFISVTIQCCRSRHHLDEYVRLCHCFISTGSIAEGLVHRSAVASSAAVTPSVRHAAASSSKFAPLQQSAEQMEQERPADTDYDAIFENSSAPIPTQQSSASASQDMEYVTAASSCSADSESSCAADAIVVGHATSTSTKDKKRKATAASAVTEQDRQSKRHQRENRQEHKSTDGRHDGDCERDVLMDVPLSEDELQQAPAGHIDAADVEMEVPIYYNVQ